jgi:uncharacterized protein DUF3224
MISPLLAGTEPVNPSNIKVPMHQRATATVTVQHSEAKPYDETASPTLKDLTLQEKFSGDINGESLVRALQIFHENGSATMTSVQRFKGTLGKRSGTFVLQGSEQIQNGKIQAKWFVAPGSGTGELAGLRGEGGFSGNFGQGSTAELEYWFE